jgi:hypothetical protein
MGRRYETQASDSSGDDVQDRYVMFHLDEHLDWIADLACGHERQLEHTSLWNYRYWLTTPQGRLEYLGQELNCLACLA